MTTMIGDWLYADAWEGRVVIDRVDVSQRCRAVLVRGEVPVAVEVYRLTDAGRAFVLARDARGAPAGLVTDVVVSRGISVQLRPRREIP